MQLLRGKVRSGAGDFSQWLVKLEPLYFAKTGLRLFPGTLNIELPDSQRGTLLKNAPRIKTVSGRTPVAS